MKAEKIIKVLEKKYPLCNCESWDNSGLILGDPSREIKKIQLSLDITEEAIDNCLKEKAQMIISHHPMIFSSIKKIAYDEPLGKKIIKLIKNDIVVYAMHTNLDSSKDGLNEYILKKLGIKKFKILDTDPIDNTAGIGRIYSLEKEMTLVDYIHFIKNKLDIKDIRVQCNNINKKIKKIALVNGSGMEYWTMAKKQGADVFITGDVKHHDALDATESGIDVIDIGHYQGEKIFAELLIKNLKDYEIDVTIYNDRRFLTNF